MLSGGTGSSQACSKKLLRCNQTCSQQLPNVLKKKVLYLMPLGFLRFPAQFVGMSWKWMFALRMSAHICCFAANAVSSRLVFSAQDVQQVQYITQPAPTERQKQDSASQLSAELTPKELTKLRIQQQKRARQFAKQQQQVSRSHQCCVHQSTSHDLDQEQSEAILQAVTIAISGSTMHICMMFAECAPLCR